MNSALPRLARGPHNDNRGAGVCATNFVVAQTWFAGFMLLVVANCMAEPPRWVQSYGAGYSDDAGAWAGGSEIMHLVSHNGKLFAANGYWLDYHWVIPPEGQKQSAQVLRLDASDGRWQVDLDMGKSNEYGLEYMKGNILKSVTFTRDATGNPLAAPQTLLVMSSGANFDGGGAVSVWVRDDSSEEWVHTLVRHGSGGRWVPRDLEIHRDRVTGVERLFLLLGNPGIISGVFDPQSPGKIRWDRHLEYPFLTKGNLSTRPLGIAIANGALHFSEGDSIFRRNDGARPTYTEILDLNDDTDTDVGGIRGLTTVKNPNGPGDSLLMLWAPGGRSTSQVKRLDPDAKGGYTVHDEANMLDLMSKALDVKVTYTLGAHNMMYPVVHPETKETVHIIGFQGNIHGKDNLRWKGSALYGGAMYAVRTSDGKYSVHEVNNQYESEKTPLVSPRAFCLSPFGDNELFIGGHDSSNKVSDNMAWIFKAPLPVALGAAVGHSAPPRLPPSPGPRLLAGPVYELRIYTAGEGRFGRLINRFREHTDRLFKQHGLEPVGYWLPVDEKKHRRKFIYILKHPSRYAAYQNWTRFVNSREWQAVLDMPEFQGLLSERPTSIFMAENDYSSLADVAIEKSGGLYELRTYVANPDKLASLNARFRDHTTKLFNKHGVASLGYWTPFDKPGSTNTLIYLLHHESRAQADANWKAVQRDPDWRKAAHESQLEGTILAQPPERIYLEAQDFSPLE